MPTVAQKEWTRSPLSKRQLLRAAHHVISHRKAPGYDGVRPEELKGKRLGLFVTELHRNLRDCLWKPSRARKGELLRPGKPPREHAIATLADAVVLRATVEALDGVWLKLPKSIVGGRPGGNHQHVITTVSGYIAGGAGSTFRFDLSSAFASASFDEAIERLCLLTERHDLVGLIVRWRKKQGDHFGGLVEGAAYAPLLLAVLLADAVIAMEKLPGIVRLWLDDGIFLARDRATALKAKRLLVEKLKQAGRLKLHPKKSGVHSFNPSDQRPTKFNFLGVAWKGWLTVPLAEGVESIFSDLHQMVARDERGALAESWAGFVASVVRGNSCEDVLSEIDERFETEIGSTSWPWGPFESLVGREQVVALRERRGSQTRWMYRPGTSGAGRRPQVRGLKVGAVPGTAAYVLSSTAFLTDLDIPTQSSATGAPEAGMVLASGARSASEAQ